MTHVCSGVGGEVDVALELLCGLVTEKPSEMALYAIFVKVRIQLSPKTCFQLITSHLSILYLTENCSQQGRCY